MYLCLSKVNRTKPINSKTSTCLRKLLRIINGNNKSNYTDTLYNMVQLV